MYAAAENRTAAQAQYGRYQQQSAMTASPGELTLMLYDGCIKFMKQARMYMEDKNIEKASNACIRAQDILSEFMATLDMSFEISHNLYNLYDFIMRCVIQANLKKDPEMLETPISMVTELRDTWQQAIKLNRMQTAAQGGYHQ